MTAERVGEPGPPRDGRWADDLRDGRAAIAAAGDALAGALEAGAFPVLLAADCTIAMATLPVLVAREPDVRLVWLDAHGDFNTPDTTASGFLGGMCLAAACGRWDAGFPGAFDPARVLLGDARDLDPDERDELARAGVALTAPDAMADAVRGERIFLHVDLDVLDPSEMAFSFPAAHGLSLEALRGVLGDARGVGGDRRRRDHVDRARGGRAAGRGARAGDRLAVDDLALPRAGRLRVQAPVVVGDRVGVVGRARRDDAGDRDRGHVEAGRAVLRREQLRERAHARLAEREARHVGHRLGHAAGEEDRAAAGVGHPRAEVGHRRDGAARR